MKPSTKFGLINAGAGVLWAMIMYVTGLNRNAAFMWIQFIALIIPIICIIQVTKIYLQTEGNGFISFGKAFNLAFKVTSIGAIIGAFYHFLYLKFIDPSYVDYQMNLQLEKLQERGMSEDMIEKQITMIGKWMTPMAQCGFAIVVGIIMAAVISLIMAAIVKKPNPDAIS